MFGWFKIKKEKFNPFKVIDLYAYPRLRNVIKTIKGVPKNFDILEYIDIALNNGNEHIYIGKREKRLPGDTCKMLLVTPKFYRGPFKYFLIHGIVPNVKYLNVVKDDIGIITYEGTCRVVLTEKIIKKKCYSKR